MLEKDQNIKHFVSSSMTLKLLAFIDPEAPKSNRLNLLKKHKILQEFKITEIKSTSIIIVT